MYVNSVHAYTTVNTTAVTSWNRSQSIVDAQHHISTWTAQRTAAAITAAVSAHVEQKRERITAVTLVPSSVNGDIAIQWEWSKFDPSQNPNPLTDYDKTLHNWLCPRDEYVTQNLCQSAVRERLVKYVKYKASLFYFYFFPRTRLLK